jgi:formylglycine-generating enzyme required for sulfatase activity
MLACLLAVCVVAGCDGRSDAEHFQREETPVSVTAPEGVQWRLLASGRSIDASLPSGQAPDDPVWLPPGRWMIEADDGARTWHYPLTIRGFRSGPDKDGAFVVSIRRMPAEGPPAILGMSFAPVASGWFLFGDRRRPLEPHFIWLSTFFMSVGEVRNDTYRAFLKSPDGWSADDVWTSAGLEWRRESVSRSSASLSTSDPAYPRFGRDSLPVTGVTWYEAMAFARWVSKTCGDGVWDFALPNEAEWEKAARGPDDLEYVLAASISDQEASWFNWKKNPGAEVSVVPVTSSAGGFRPNRYGLFHHSGNVTEWTRSLAEPFSRVRPFRLDRQTDEGADQRVACGGSWYSASTALLSVSYREAFLPTHRTQELGFRLRAVRLPAVARP